MKAEAQAMISRRTIFSLLLALLLALGIHTWVLWHRDECDRLDAHGKRPAAVMVDMGSHTVAMSCSLWVPRQPVGVQFALLLNAAVGVVFLLSVGMDWARTRERRKAEAQ